MHESLPILPDLRAEGPVRPIFSEIFAGCGRLSRAAKMLGFATLPVDGPRNEHKPECQILTLDLVDPMCQQMLLDNLRQLRPQAIHVALPCGTGSRAREKPVPQHLIAQGAPQPRPLRNQEFPLGLPHLSTYEKAKVSSANALAMFTIELFVLASMLNAVFSVENPSNSWMWAVLLHYVKALQDPVLITKWLNMSEVQFSNCAHGGERPKQTTLRCSHKVFNHMALQCPGDHEHKPYHVSKQANRWKFDTAGESEYPWLLCVRMCQALQQHLQSEFRFEPIQRPPVGHVQSKHHRALVPEYFTITNTKPLDDNFKLLPPILRGELIGEDSSEQRGQQADKYGIFHTPEQFLEKAMALQHPFDSVFAVEDITRKNLFEMLTKGFSFVANKRLQFAKKVACWSKELAAEEARFFATFPDHAQKVLRGKKLLLYRKLLEESGCPDIEPFELMQGLDLVGTASKSKFFDTKLNLATASPGFALLTAKWQRHKIEARDVHADDKEMSKLLLTTPFKKLTQVFWRALSMSLAKCRRVWGARMLW